jgi:hypothetical protein
MVNPHDTDLIKRALSLGGAELVESIHKEAIAAVNQCPADLGPESPERARTYRGVWRQRIAEHEAR